MADSTIYQKLQNEHNQKEQDLIAKLKFYKENKDQLVRIKILEHELEGLQTELNKLSQIKMREMYQKKENEEYLKIISENCKNAYEIYLVNKKNFVQNFNKINIKKSRHDVIYTFEEINEKEVKVTIYIHELRKNVNGLYHVDNGLSIKS
jgi:hypothetical protein